VTELVSDPLAQIDDLVAANRAHRSEATEELLVRLRVDAANRLTDRPASALRQPPAIDDFAGMTQFVEIEASDLTVDRLASAILWHGALLVRGLVPRDQLEVLSAALDRKDALAAELATSDAEGKARLLREQAAAALRAGLPKMMCTPTMLFDLIELYTNLGVCATITEYIGERPVLMAERVRVGRARGGPDSALPWHQDAAFFGGTVRGVNVWLAISPCGVESPALDFIPRRFDDICGSRPDDAFPFPLAYGDRFGPDDVRALAGEYTIASPTFDAGDALLFDEYTFHRTSRQEWRAPYKDAAVTWFFAPSRLPINATPLLF
jgi:ectoine hydroxylase-related dioxygenase (phytanoyl-CoA dioxygenase family)